MTVLIIEDDQGKGRQLAEIVEKLIPDATILERRSYQSGLKEAVLTSPQIVVLDMSLPSFDVNSSIGELGGDFRPYGGRDLMREMSRRKLHSRVIIVTQYDVFQEGQDMMTLDQLKAHFVTQFPSNYVATVYYQAGQSTWQTELADALTIARQ